MMTPAGKWTVATFTSKGVTFKGSQWTAGWRASRAEFTGDGLADLFLYNPKNGKFRVVVRKGTTFTILKGAWSKNLTVDISDLNRDGLSDLVVYDPVAGTWGAATATAKPGAFVYLGGTFEKSRALLAAHSTRP